MSEVAEDIVEKMIDDAYSIREEQQELRDRKSAIRDSLRNLKETGHVTDEQAKEIDELFPPITRKRGTKTEQEAA